jgi:hypothetical protein
MDWVPLSIQLAGRLGTAALFLRLVLLLSLAALFWSWNRWEQGRSARWRAATLSLAYLLPALIANDPFPKDADPARSYPVTNPPLAQLHPRLIGGELFFLAGDRFGLHWRGAADPLRVPEAQPPWEDGWAEGPNASLRAATRGEPGASRIEFRTSEGRTVVVSPPATWATEPAFSPDGKRLAFSAWQNGNWDVFVRSNRGGPSIRLTRDPARDRSPTWLDDRTVVFTSDRRRGLGFSSLYQVALPPTG